MAESSITDGYDCVLKAHILPTEAFGRKYDATNDAITPFFEGWKGLLENRVREVWGEITEGNLQFKSEQPVGQMVCGATLAIQAQQAGIEYDFTAEGVYESPFWKNPKVTYNGTITISFPDQGSIPDHPDQGVRKSLALLKGLLVRREALLRMGGSKSEPKTPPTPEIEYSVRGQVIEEGRGLLARVLAQESQDQVRASESSCSPHGYICTTTSIGLSWKKVDVVSGRTIIHQSPMLQSDFKLVSHG